MRNAGGESEGGAAEEVDLFVLFPPPANLYH